MMRIVKEPGCDPMDRDPGWEPLLEDMLRTGSAKITRRGLFVLRATLFGPNVAYMYRGWRLAEDENDERAA